MASGTITKPLNANMNTVNTRLRANEEDYSFRYQRGNPNKTYRRTGTSDTILLIGSWGSNPRLHMITFNGNGNATVANLNGVESGITASVANGISSFKLGEYLYCGFISARGFLYEEVTT